MSSESNENERSGHQTLWVISEPYYPEETSTGYYLTRIAEGLADNFKVKVMCGQPNYSARDTNAPKHEIHRNVEIFRAAGTRLNKNVILWRVINMATLGTSIFFRALFNFRKGDKILVVTTPPSLPFIAAIASLKCGASYTLLIHDNYPEILVAAGKTNDKSLVTKLMDFCNRWLYKYAAKIVVVGRDMQELVAAKTAGLDVPVVTIPNWAELESVRPEPKSDNKLLRQLGLGGKFLFLYAGNMGHPNDLKSIVKCAEMLLDRPAIHFIFLGTGAKKPWLESKVHDKKLTNVTILDPRPRNEQIIFLNACDIALVSLVSKMWGVSMPSRTYNILAAGKPILALTDAGSELARVIDEDSIGWVVPPEEPETLIRTILDIYNNREVLDIMGGRARDCALAKYSLETALQRYRNEL